MAPGGFEPYSHFTLKFSNRFAEKIRAKMLTDTVCLEVQIHRRHLCHLRWHLWPQGDLNPRHLD